jgi:serine/threonine protein kinase
MITRLSRERRFGADQRYRPVAQLSEDHFGTVWTAEDIVWHRDVSLRVIAEPLISDSQFMARLTSAMDELMRPLITGRGMLPRISHPNAARPLGFEPGGEGTPPLIIMEPLTGRSMALLLDQGPRPTTGLIFGLTLAIAGALQSANDMGVVHGGVNPTNVLIDPGGMVKVIDFGVMSAWVSTRGTVDPDPSLAPYIAPELLAGQPPSSLSDAFSVAAVLRSLLVRYSQEGEGASQAAPSSAMTANELLSRSHSLKDLIREISALPVGAVAKPQLMPDRGGFAPELVEPREVPVESDQSRILELRFSQPPVPLLRGSSVEETLRDTARSNRRKPPPWLRQTHVKNGLLEAGTGTETPAGHRRPWRLILGILALVIMLAAGGSIFWLESSRARSAHTPRGAVGSAPGPTRLKTGSAMVTVPDLRGLTVTQSLERLQAVGLKVNSLKPAVGNPGLVHRSKPAAGKKVRRGAGVVLFVGVTEDRIGTSG